MEWIERLNDAISYIEEHLTEEIDMNQLGRIACCSSYHFQRMFTYMAGVPLSEYIRRRKMSLAAVDLQGRGMKIIDVAGKYGYSSPTAFNRAFQSVHGIAPSSLKKEGVSVKLSEEVVDPEDIEMLEDLIVAATNEALRQMEEANSQAMAKLTGGLGGLGGGLPF